MPIITYRVPSNGFLPKGQLISEGLFDILNSPKKTNQTIRIYYDASGRLVFICFWEKLKTPKKHFEIN